MLKLKDKAKKRFDMPLFGITVFLCIFGLITLYSATLTFPGNKMMITQAIATLLGFLILGIIVCFDYQILGDFYKPIYIISNLLLVAVLLFGTGEDQWGARSWLDLKFIIFQPSEFVKFGIIISLAKYIDLNKDYINEPFTLLKILAFAFLPIFLILLQPDAGTAMVFIFFIAIMLFVAGIKWKYVFYAIGAGVASLPILWFRLDQYQVDRVLNFLSPERDASNTGYQAYAGKIAIGSGKLFGRGLFKGTQTQFHYIPEKQTDFIYVVIVEELGFIGGALVLILYYALLRRFIKIAKESTDLFGSLMVVGIAAIFIFHIFENIGMTMGVMPITGIPLPFISHGGTFQLVNLAFIGIILSVGVHREDLSF